MIPFSRQVSAARHRPWPAVAGLLAALVVAALAAGANALGANAIGTNALGATGDGAATRAAGERPRFPHLLLITVDTLRADRVSAYGYHRPTTPAIDRLLSGGVIFTNARTVEPLTGPALCSLVTSLHPHEHGASRNGLRMRPGLVSLPARLGRRGYRTAAFVSNWTLRDRLTGLGEHFSTYEEVLNRKRWVLFTSEADASDVTDAALDWLEEYADEGTRRPFFAWVHYSDPHAPYLLRDEVAGRLKVTAGDGASRSDRYDTEVAFTDREIGRLLAGVERLGLARDALVAFTADHGESLGEHRYWGHGRHLYEPTLHIPLGISWPGRVPAGRRLDAPASILDLAPTVLGLLAHPAEASFRGYDWSGVLLRGEAPPADRVTTFQAHKGAVVNKSRAERARQAGLLEVGRLANGVKEIFRLPNGRHQLYDLEADPRELDDLANPHPSAELREWLEKVRAGLAAAESLPDAELDDEAVERLKALGYVDG